MKIALAVLALATLAPAVPAVSGAQTPTPIKLAPANATHPEEFSSITSVRELSDGRVIVTDRREQRILVLDFRTGSSETIGRRGGGPNEYGMVAEVLASRGDSSVMVDFMARRVLLFDGPRISVTVPPDDPAVVASQGAVLGADGLGRFLTRRTAPRKDGVTVTGKEDSTAIVLVDRRTGKADTVAMTRNMPIRYTQRSNAEGRVMEMSMFPTGPLVTDEQAVLFPDGTLAVARLEPFRVDWRSPTGQWTRGAPLPVSLIKVDARERRVFLERNAASYGPPPPGSGMPPRTPPTASEFPEFIPPFTGGSTRMGPAGTLLVRRTKSADFPNLNYFVIDRRGRLLGEIALAPNEEIVGVGARSLYVTAKDEDDLISLRRHPWTQPAAAR